MAAKQPIKTLAGLTRRDFFGIHDITSKDIAAAFNNPAKLDHRDRHKKYDALIRTRARLVNEVQEKKTNFGAVRYDQENVVKTHGQYEANNCEKLYDTIQVKQMFVPDRLETEGHETASATDSSKQEVVDVVQIGNPAYKISEVDPIKTLHEVLDVFKGPNDRAKYSLRYVHKPPLTFFFQGVPRDVEPEIPPKIAANAKHHQMSNIPKSSAKPSDELRRPQREYDDLAGPDGVKAPLHELDPMSEESMQIELAQNREEKFDRKLDEKYDVNPKPTKSMNALNYLKKVRSSEIEPLDKHLRRNLKTTEKPYSFKPHIKLDSKGFNNYKFQVPDWNSVRRVDALTYIKKCIVYHNYDILAINKPYGISSHEFQTDRETFDMNTLVGEVAKSMRIDKVYLAHRLDKTTTGILLFATSKERAQDLHNLFRNGEIKKTYWCITKGIPSPPKCVVDMPIAVFKVAGKLKCVPAPENLDQEQQLSKKYKEARRAVTEFEVIDKTKHMAFVACRPQTGVKHQIRCHLAFGLKTPIFGDHKYSHLDKFAPQVLPQKVLEALRIRQTKVRSIPTHLHAKTIVIPSAKPNGESLFIEADLPQHFRDNLQTLGLKQFKKQ